jgi:tRNA(fMet)-specific endonuclease VapC
VRYLLDTDHISFLQRRTGPEHLALVSRMARHARGDFGSSVVSFHEQALGAHTYVSRGRTTAEVVRGYSLMGEILRGFLAAPVVPFDTSAGTVFDSFRSQRVRLATMDLRIAAIAMSRGLTILTRNVADFGQVPGLQTEDWTV